VGLLGDGALQRHHSEVRTEFPLGSSTRDVNLNNAVKLNVATHWLAAPSAPKIFNVSGTSVSTEFQAGATEANTNHAAQVRLQRSPTNLRLDRSRRRFRVAPLMGFRSRSATPTSEHGPPELASLSTFPSRAFSAPQGFASRWLLRPCFMPQPLFGFSPSEFSPRVTAATISGPLPS
jgi:hypothetical protein